ncbi:hypothetical protein [Streptomyces sp. NBC_00425]|uniref:hypothetical protein n=1 Tax=Streptomyces sp. NBC_00425 TaxID=2975740 RepID=UPI002E20B068
MGIYAKTAVTAAVALDSVSGDGATVVEQQLQGRVEEETTAAGGIRRLQVLAISGDMGAIATAVYGALGTGPPRPTHPHSRRRTGRPHRRCLGHGG